jgi:hypothetical protein
MNILHWIDHHFDAIFLGWLTALMAASITALNTKRHWLRLACSGIVVVLLIGNLILLFAFLITH